jgi:hypothetical protein
MTPDAMPNPTLDQIDRLVEEWSSALIARAQVFDGLLDLRSTVREDPTATAIVDRALAGVPGKNLVAREWAVGVLMEVGALAGRATLVR